MKETTYEVIIVGGGTAGVIAALASARSGAKTLLLEESTNFGGTNTKALVGPLTSFKGEKNDFIVGGIPLEIIDELESIGASKGAIPDPIGFAYSLTPVDFSMLKIIQGLKLTNEANLSYRLREMVIAVEREAERVTGVKTIDNQGQEHLYYGEIIIDATGDADVVAKASESYEYGREGDRLTQPMSLIFSLENVDFEQIKKDIAADKENFVLSAEENKNYLAVSGYFNEVAAAVAKEDFPVMRDRLLFFEGLHEGEVYCNTTRIVNKNSLSSQEYAEAYGIGIKQVYELWQWMRTNILAFKESFIGQVGELGIRETRRIKGHKTLTVEDILNGRRQEKSIALGAYPIDIHSPEGEGMNFFEEKTVKNYEIDLAMVVPKGLDNVMVAGRAISASHEAHASSRVSATCMAIGQATGVIAALAVKEQCLIEELNYQKIKMAIEEIGGIVTK